MANYLSKFTGDQIDENIGLLNGNGLSSVGGLVKREKTNGTFSAAGKEDIAALGVPVLDENNEFIPSMYLPSYVDDVIEGYYYDNKFYEEPEHTTLIPAEPGKIYIDITNSLTYRWGGSQYVKIASALALGETSATAYRGDRGKIAYDFATNASTTPAADVGVKYNSSAKTSSTDMTDGELEDFFGNIQRGVGLLDIGQKNADSIAVGLTQTLSLADGWTGTVKYDKFNDLVVIYFNINFNEVISSDTRIDGTPLDSSYRPVQEEIEYVRSINEVTISVNENGQVKILVNGETIPTTVSIKGEVAYFI